LAASSVKEVSKDTKKVSQEWLTFLVKWRRVAGVLLIGTFDRFSIVFFGFTEATGFFKEGCLWVTVNSRTREPTGLGVYVMTKETFGASQLSLVAGQAGWTQRDWEAAQKLEFWQKMKWVHDGAAVVTLRTDMASPEERMISRVVYSARTKSGTGKRALTSPTLQPGTYKLELTAAITKTWSFTSTVTGQGQMVYSHSRSQPTVHGQAKSWMQIRS
jgi:hypothetical protein